MRYEFPIATSLSLIILTSISWSWLGPPLCDTSRQQVAQNCSVQRKQLLMRLRCWAQKIWKHFFFQGMVKSFNPLIPLVQHQHWFRPMVGTWVNLPASLPNLGLRVSSQTILSVTLATCWSFQYRRYGYLSQQRIWKLDQKWLQWKCQSCYLMKFIIISMLLVRDFG